jgi:hypothetical protein
MSTTNSCPACAYKDGVSKETFIAVALLGETDNAVADAVAMYRERSRVGQAHTASATLRTGWLLPSA